VATSMSLKGRVAVVTGATSGIGKEVARGLARQGASVVIVGRGDGRAARVATEIGQSTGNPDITSLRADDLALQAQVRTLGAAVLDRFPQVHILVNNAGAYFARRDVTSEGLERTFALNVLAPYTLTTMLLPRLRAGAPARVVNVSSAAHRGARVDLSDLQSTGRYGGFSVYGASKLELIWLTREFARRLAGTGVTVNAVHPGFVHSGFGLNNGGGTAFLIRVTGKLFGRTLVRGADTPTYVASSPEISTVTGSYFANRKVNPGSPDSQDLVRAAQLFDACARLSGLPPFTG